MEASTQAGPVSSKPAGHPSGDKRFKLLETTMKRHLFQQHALIEVLHAAQQLFGYLDHDLLYFIARPLKLPPSKVYGVVTFYHLFSLKPRGMHTCVVCLGTACYVKGRRLAGGREPAGAPQGRRHHAGQPVVAADGTLPGGLRRGAGGGPGRDGAVT